MALAQRAAGPTRLGEARRRLRRRGSFLLAVFLGALGALGAGAAVGTGGGKAELMVAAAVGLGGGTFAWSLIGRRGGGALALEAPPPLLLFSHFGLRVRTAPGIPPHP